MYPHARQNSSQHCVSDASCMESVILFLKTASYFRFRQSSARFAQTDLEDRLI